MVGVEGGKRALLWGLGALLLLTLVTIVVFFEIFRVGQETLRGALCPTAGYGPDCMSMYEFTVFYWLAF